MPCYPKIRIRPNLQQYLCEITTASTATTKDTPISATIEAMNWIREHTPEDTVFLSNAWYRPGRMTLGTDAGGWIPLLT